MQANEQKSGATAGSDAICEYGVGLRERRRRGAIRGLSYMVVSHMWDMGVCSKSPVAMDRRMDCSKANPPRLV